MQKRLQKMNSREEDYNIVNSLIYEMLGGAINYFYDYKLNEYDNPSFDIGMTIFNDATNKAIFLHIYWMWLNEEELPMAIYKIFNNERALTEEKEKLKEAVKDGHYHTWRFVSSQFENVQNP